MVKNLKSLLAGTALLSLVGCVSPEVTVHSYPTQPRYPVRVTRTEHFYFSIQNIPSRHHQRNFSNPTYNGWNSRSTWNDHKDRGHHEYSGKHKRK